MIFMTWLFGCDTLDLLAKRINNDFMTRERIFTQKNYEERFGERNSVTSATSLLLKMGLFARPNCNSYINLKMDFVHFVITSMQFWVASCMDIKYSEETWQILTSAISWPVIQKLLWTGERRSERYLQNYVRKALRFCLQSNNGPKITHDIITSKSWINYSATRISDKP